MAGEYDEFGPKGAAGRRLARPKEAPKPAAAVPDTPSKAAPIPVDPRAPFTHHQAERDTLEGASDQSAAKRAPWVTLGTALVTGLTTVLLVFVAIAEGWRPVQPAPILSPTTPRHLTDAGYAGAIVDNEPPPMPGQPAAAPRPGPLKIFTSSDRGFVSIEVDCTATRFQDRGRFFPEGPGKMAATVRRVPPNEKCRVTFQGTEAATTWAYAHETRECVSFNPTVCPVR